MAGEVVLAIALAFYDIALLITILSFQVGVVVAAIGGVIAQSDKEEHGEEAPADSPGGAPGSW